MPIINFSREMQGKRSDIMRQLPEAFGEETFDEEAFKENADGVLELRDDAGRYIALDVVPLERRELGELSLPMLRLDFSFEGYTRDEVDALMERFDNATLRVGGGP